MQNVPVRKATKKKSDSIVSAMKRGPKFFRKLLRFRGATGSVQVLDPLQLGQPAIARPVMVRYELDTIFLKDNCCRGFRRPAPGSVNALDYKVTNSPDWHRIQHLAMPWINFQYWYQYAYVFNDMNDFITAILKMRSLKTFIIVATYIRHGVKGRTDCLIDLEEYKDEVQRSTHVPLEIPQRLEEACKTHQTEI